MGHFSIVDFLILLIIAICVVRSAMRGFIREIFRIATILVAVILAGFFYHRAGPLFKDVVKTENLALFLAFFVIFLGTLLVGVLVVWLITRFMKFAKLEWADRVLGAAFGFIRGWLVVAVVLLALTAFDVQTERIKNSGLAPYFLPGARVIAVMTPYDLKARFLVGYRSVEKWWRERT